MVVVGRAVVDGVGVDPDIELVTCSVVISDAVDVTSTGVVSIVVVDGSTLVITPLVVEVIMVVGETGAVSTSVDVG